MNVNDEIVLIGICILMAFMLFLGQWSAERCLINKIGNKQIEVVVQSTTTTISNGKTNTVIKYKIQNNS